MLYSSNFAQSHESGNQKHAHHPPTSANNSVMPTTSTPKGVAHSFPSCTPRHTQQELQITDWLIKLFMQLQCTDVKEHLDTIEECTQTHIHTRMHMPMCMRTHMHLYASACTSILMCAHAHAHTHTHTHIHTHMHTHTHTHTRARARAHTICICTQKT